MITNYFCMKERTRADGRLEQAFLIWEISSFGCIVEYEMIYDAAGDAAVILLYLWGLLEIVIRWHSRSVDAIRGCYVTNFLVGILGSNLTAIRTNHALQNKAMSYPMLQ